MKNKYSQFYCTGDFIKMNFSLKITYYYYFQNLIIFSL